MPEATFLLRSEEELKKRVGRYFKDHSEDFGEYIGIHLFNQMKLDKDPKNCTHDYVKRHCSEKVLSLLPKNPPDPAGEEEPEEIIKELIDQLTPEEAYDFCMISWVYGSDYSYQPELYCLTKTIVDDVTYCLKCGLHV